MNKQWFFTISIIAIIVFSFADSAVGVEKIDRGLIATERGDGSVFLSWRLLGSDSVETAFEIRRAESSSSSRKDDLLTGRKPYRLTHFADRPPKKDAAYTYRLYRSGDDSKPLDEFSITLTGRAKPYLSIALQGDYDFQKVAIADLDGDGVYEYVIKQPNFNTDPYQQPGYWKRSTSTYKIEAYRQDGTFLWRYDMGWAIEEGIWYSPWIVYDVDGDGKAEVYCKAGEGDPRDEKGLVQSGPEYLVKLDGETGKVVAKTSWLSREGYRDYNRYCRNFLTVAYLDGRAPSLIMQRGTYNLIRTQALDKNFRKIWSWESFQEKKNYRGQGSHGLISADIDNDGRDELVIGAAAIDDNGKGLWTLEMGHPDECYVADIDPDNPGLEVYYGFETRQNTDGLCVVDAKTGRKLWTHKEPTKHVHGQGMAADVLVDYPGMEVYGGERDLKKRWLYSAKGELIQLKETGTLSPRALWWDADPQKEVIFSRDIRDWNGPPIQAIEGRVIAIVDCVGDYREEVITALKGELRIYTTPIPAKDRRVCLMQDRQYRLGITAQTMGYYYPAQLGK